ncbi:MAG: GNAT family protein [Gammaproteobacteria bacterium]|nr:GNAT family protein [Gammaproteobacteria bacterium]
MIEPVTLEGEHVRLEPLSQHHREALCDAIRDGELWTLHVTFVPHPDQIGGFLSDAEKLAADGSGLVFATVHRGSGRVIGSTRYMHRNEVHRRVEIGFTFLAKSHQRTAVNTEAKLLMLTHAFETLAMNRVELLTDVLNTASRRAILRIGAKEEGVLRSHMIMPDGRVRDSALYSIVRSEWPDVKAHLEGLLARVS